MTKDQGVRMEQGGSASTGLYLRFVAARDMDDILAIERASFEFPWSRAEFIKCSQKTRCVRQVAEEGERVVGYMVYDFGVTRIRLLNLAVAADCRRRGIGRQMIAQLIRMPETRGRIRLTLKICETNLAAAMFFKALGFRAVAILKRPWDETDHDGYLMRYPAHQGRRPNSPTPNP